MNTIHPILITGTPRSGGSMIAEIIGMCGRDGGDALNKMQENEIAWQMLSQVISGMGADPCGQYPLPDVQRVQLIGHWADTIDSIYTRPWYMKDARLSLTWPLWAAAFPNARWIVVRRNVNDIVNSCVKTKYMTAMNNPQYLEAIGASTPEEGWRWWAGVYQERFLEMTYAIRYIHTVWVERMAFGDFTEMQQLIDWLGLEWNPNIEAYMNEKLKNSPQKRLL